MLGPTQLPFRSLMLARKDLKKFSRAMFGWFPWLVFSITVLGDAPERFVSQHTWGHPCRPCEPILLFFRVNKVSFVEGGGSRSALLSADFFFTGQGSRLKLHPKTGGGLFIFKDLVGIHQPGAPSRDWFEEGLVAS